MKLKLTGKTSHSKCTYTLHSDQGKQVSITLNDITVDEMFPKSKYGPCTVIPYQREFMTIARWIDDITTNLSILFPSHKIRTPLVLCTAVDGKQSYIKCHTCVVDGLMS